MKKVYEITDDDGTKFGMVREGENDIEPLDHFYIDCGCGGKQHRLGDSEESYEHTFYMNLIIVPGYFAGGQSMRCEECGKEYSFSIFEFSNLFTEILSQKPRIVED